MFPRLEIEKELYEQGIDLIAGVDEVGRGPLAGPMVVSAVILDLKKLFGYKEADNTNNDVKKYQKINDSKKLSETIRVELSDFIVAKAISYKIIEKSHTLIDTLGISKCTQDAFYEAVMGLHIKPAYILTDNFRINNFPESIQKNIIKGDAKSLSIGAASIIGKVYRDALMVGEDKTYPEYGFAIHKGYGTASHLDAIKKYGPCPIHRHSFEPIKSWFK